MTTTIGFIGGGQMAEALIKGTLTAELFTKETIFFIEPNEERQAFMKCQYGIQAFSAQQDLWKACDTVVLAVKPQVMQTVIQTMAPFVSAKHLIITIAAGLPLHFYENGLQRADCKLIRVMPNTPALVMEGASAICSNANVTPEDLQIAQNIFNAVGTSVVLDECYLDAVTGLSGSGPAYVFTFIESLIDAGIKEGLSRQHAESLAVQTVIGSAKLIQQQQEHPAVLRAKVTSPGGTTIAGQYVLEREGMRGIVMDAVEAATQRSRELGKR